MNRTAVALLVVSAVVLLLTRRRMLANVLTVQEMRNDPAGRGHFGAARGSRLHKGLDLIAQPGERVYSPVDGRFIRRGKVYATAPHFDLVELHGEGYAARLLYVEAVPWLEGGDEVRRGELIGYAQNVSERWRGGMLPHVHVELRTIVGNELRDPEEHFRLT